MWVQHLRPMTANLAAKRILSCATRLLSLPLQLGLEAMNIPLLSRILLLCVICCFSHQVLANNNGYTEPFLSEMTVSAAEAEQKLVQSIAILKALFDANLSADLLQHAEAVVIVPSLFRVSFVMGGKSGSGILLFRLPNGEWSSPLFILLSGGSVGLQLGASSSDLVLLFRHASDLDSLETGKVTLTALAAVAAGTLGKATESATDIHFKADIYAWLRSKGLFLGLALEGALLDIDDATMQSFYDSNVSFTALKQGDEQSHVASVMELRSLLAELTAVAPD